MLWVEELTVISIVAIMMSRMKSLGFKVATKILWVKDLSFKVATDMLLVLTQIYVATIITLLVEAVPLVLEGSREQNVL